MTFSGQAIYRPNHRFFHAKVKHFLSPLGVGDRLIGWGIPASKVQQFDWWEETQIGSVKVIATPAQHFSGRGLAGRDSTLWASWVLITPKAGLFFSGDTGYFDGFKVVGERFGPFDITLLENGAYNQGWADIHMHPEETVQAHIDLRGKQLVPIHNGTFDLSLHGWTDPLDILHPAKGMAWWRTAEPNQEVARAKPDKEAAVRQNGREPAHCRPTWGSRVKDS